MVCTVCHFMVCTVCHFTLFKNWLKHIFVLTAYVWEAAPCSPPQMRMQYRIFWDHHAFQLVPVSHSSYEELILTKLIAYVCHEVFFLCFSEYEPG